MSEPYQIAIVIPDGLPAEIAIRRCHRVLGEEGIRVAADSLLLLGDTGAAEPDPEPVPDEASALRRLIAWPTLGSIDYAGPEGMVCVSYHGPPGQSLLTCVVVSAQQRAFEQTDALPRYRLLAARLHQELGARRTVMEWGLEMMQGLSPVEEIARLRLGRFDGAYSLLDLRS